MPSFSKSLRLIAPGAALAYSVLLMPSAHAQASPITPVGESAPVAAPVPVAPAPSDSAPPQLDLQFDDVDVASVLNMIGRQLKVNIIVSGDVTGTLKSINLTGMSPVQAIKQVAMAANLQYRLQDGTYIIGKTLPPDPNAPATISPSTSGLPDPASGFNQSPIVPGGSMATGGNSALNQFGSDGMGAGLPSLSASSRYSVDDIGLVNNNPTNRNRQTPIRVRNVKASVMAYWIDPAHNPMPIEFQVAQDNNSRYGKQNPARLALGNEAQAILNSSGLNGNNGGGSVAANPYFNRASGQMLPDTRANAQFGGGGFGGGGFGGGGGRGGGGAGNRSATLDLPGDIDQIIAVDPQNILLVAGGTDDDIRRLQEIINVLDRPLRQVEIEAQFVEVTINDSRQFGIDFNSSQGNFNANSVGLAPSLDPTSGGFQVGFVRGNFQATLNALLAKDRAKVLTSPRVTAINNLTASITSDTETAIVLPTAVNNSNTGGNTTAQSANVVYITTSISLSVTPTINNDDTITVLMQPTLQSQSPGSNSLGAPNLSSNSLITVANVRDGDTIALGGLRLKTVTRGGSKIPLLGDIPLVGKLFQSRRALDSDDQLIIFLKATIIRRAGDDEPVPGT